METEYHTTLRDMLRRYRLTAIYVFGSRAGDLAPFYREQLRDLLGMAP